MWPRSDGFQHEIVQASERQRQVGAALVVDDGVDLIDDHGPDGSKRRTALFGGQQNEERFRSRNDDVSGLAKEPLPFPGRRISSAKRCADDGRLGASLDSQGRDLLQWLLEVLLDVVAERFQRRHVQHPAFVRERAIGRSMNELIQADEEGCERLAGTRWGRNQHIAAVANGGPCRLLRLGRSREPAAKPFTDQRVELKHGRRRSLVLSVLRPWSLQLVSKPLVVSGFSRTFAGFELALG